MITISDNGEVRIIIYEKSEAEKARIDLCKGYDVHKMFQLIDGRWLVIGYLW